VLKKVIKNNKVQGMTMGQKSDLFNKLEDIQKRAKKKGADQVRLIASQSHSLKVGVANGDIETIESKENSGLGIEVYVGQKKSSVSIGLGKEDLVETALDEAIFNAKLQPDDPYAGLVDASELADEYASLDIFDTKVPTVEELIENAKEAGDAAFSENKLIIRASGSAAWSTGSTAILSSNGFSGYQQRTSNSLQAMTVAEKDGKRNQSGEYDAKVYFGDLDSAKIIGVEAAKRTIESLTPRMVKPQTAEVILDPGVAADLVSSFISAINSTNVVKEKTFLCQKLDQEVFAPAVTIIDDPLIERSLGSRAYDIDGIAAKELVLVENGVLKTWLFDAYDAREFNAKKGTSYKSTGHGGVGLEFYVAAGKTSPEQMISEVKDGFYITSLMNLQVNGFDGSFSSPASGFWIENGKIAHAVDGASIGGNILDVYKAMEPASDLDRINHQPVPTMRVGAMKIG
jgi:PmbA protein